jgi:hypothetical protein
MKTKQIFRLIGIAVLLLSFVFMPDATSARPLLTTVYGTANQNTYAESGYPDIPPGNQRNLYLGYDTWYNKYRTRIYIDFNLPDLPSGSQVDSAQVELYQYTQECSSSYAVTAYQVTSSWSESTLTWNAQPSKGGSVGSATFSCSAGWKTIDITNLVRNWYQGTANHGITIWANNEVAAGGIFWSNNCADSVCPGQPHPRLKVNYSAAPPPTPPYNTSWLTDADLEGDYNTSVDKIRYFLQKQNSCLASPLKDVDGVTIDIPQLIHDAAVTHRINPKVILATMQKEQSAITHCPETWRLKRLMGAGKGSTARHQIDFGTSLFRAYQDELTNNGQTRSGWKVGVAKDTQDGVSVTPATKAVAGQFTYTPYAGKNWDGNNPNVGGVWLFWNAWYNMFNFDQPLPSPPSPPPACTVPFFSQRDSRWIHHPLRTAGACSPSCNTIGRCGCTLTSGAMVFKYYGANLNPASLSDCMGTRACPFYWRTGAACSGGKSQWVNKYGFTWSRLEYELNQNDRPVIVGMHRYVNGNRYTHWVVVLKGSGSRTANYTIHDPWPTNGANMKLSAYNNWWLDSIAVYKGQPCGGNLAATAGLTASGAVTDLPTFSPEPVFASVHPDMVAPQARMRVDDAKNLAATSVMTTSVWLYRRTDVTMTVQLLADSADEKVTEMLVWTDAMTETAWQPFATFVYLPVSDEIYARFRTGTGEVSETGSDTLYPENSPETAPFEVWLPVVIRE